MLEKFDCPELLATTNFGPGFLPKEKGPQHSAGQFFCLRKPLGVVGIINDFGARP